jgi:hypothetical protein
MAPVPAWCQQATSVAKPDFVAVIKATTAEIVVGNSAAGECFSPYS